MRIVFIDGMGGGLVAQVISQAAGAFRRIRNLSGLAPTRLPLRQCLKQGLNVWPPAKTRCA